MFYISYSNETEINWGEVSKGWAFLGGAFSVATVIKFSVILVGFITFRFSNGQ